MKMINQHKLYKTELFDDSGKIGNSGLEDLDEVRVKEAHEIHGDQHEA